MPMEITLELLSQYLLVPALVICTGTCVKLCHNKYKNPRREQQEIRIIQVPEINNELRPNPEISIKIEEVSRTPYNSDEEYMYSDKDSSSYNDY